MLVLYFLFPSEIMDNKKICIIFLYCIFYFHTTLWTILHNLRIVCLYCFFISIQHKTLCIICLYRIFYFHTTYNIMHYMLVLYFLFSYDIKHYALYVCIVFFISKRHNGQFCTCSKQRRHTTR